MVSGMTHNQLPDDNLPGEHGPTAERTLSPAAARALAEADERRRALQAKAEAAPAPTEVGGRAGPDPARYGDWEKGGIVSDF